MKDRNGDIEVRPVQALDVEQIAVAMQALNKPAAKYQNYLVEQEEGRRIILAAFKAKVFVGYLTIVWKPNYLPFQAKQIPEIQDFNVLPQYRRRGVGTRLMNKAEQIVATRSSAVGIGVGMTADYGAAQRLYVLRGYVPDGEGLFWKNGPVKYGDQIVVDDDLILYFIKKLAV